MNTCLFTFIVNVVFFNRRQENCRIFIRRGKKIRTKANKKREKTKRTKANKKREKTKQTKTD
jgi:hypothetical protein